MCVGMGWKRQEVVKVREGRREVKRAVSASWRVLACWIIRTEFLKVSVNQFWLWGLVGWVLERGKGDELSAAWEAVGLGHAGHASFFDVF